MRTPTEVIAHVNELIDDPVHMMDAPGFLDWAQARSWNLEGWLEAEIEANPAALIVIIPRASAGTQIASAKFPHNTATQAHAVRHHITYSLQSMGYQSGFKGFAHETMRSLDWQVMAYFPV